MAETCLIYLRYFSENDIIFTEENITSYPFARLSALIWVDFYREVQASSELVDKTRLNRLVMEIFSCPTATLNWLKFANPDKIGEDADFDAEISQVKPAIYYAAHLGFPEIVKSLLQQGNPINIVVGPPFGTPLVVASAMGRKDVVSLLLDNSANPSLSGYFFYGTPLAAAIQYGEHGIVDMLLAKKGVDVNGRRHPPMEATVEVLEKVEEYELLRYISEDKKSQYNGRRIEIGAELIKLVETVNTEDWGDTHFKCLYGSNAINDANLEKRQKHSTDSDGEKPNSAITDNLNKTHNPEDFLLRVNAAWERIVRSAESMIYIAAKDDTLHILDILLAAGADPNLRGGSYGTALQRACAYDDSEDVLEILLKNGARTDIYGGFGGSPLHVACIYGNTRTVRILISAGADVNRLGKLSLATTCSLRAELDSRCTMVFSIIRCIR